MTALRVMTSSLPYNVGEMSAAPTEGGALARTGAVARSGASRHLAYVAGEARI